MPVRPLDPRLAPALELLGPLGTGALAVVLGGSHASGEAVWVPVAGTPRCFSDLDVHVIAADAKAHRARIEHERPRLDERLHGLGFLAPLEVGVHAPAEWAAMPPRPATLELRREGRCLAGDPAWIERLPDFAPRDVPAEEILLLLENRAFELIAARPGRTASDPIGELRACHSQYKCALDLATVERLALGAFEAGAEARVTAARAERARAGAPAATPWDAALAWRRGVVPAPPARVSDWNATLAAWWEAWSGRIAPGAAATRFDDVARQAARRARLRRRLRMALAPEMAPGHAPGLASRLAHALAGTPVHRLNASAGAFLGARLASLGGEDAAAVRARLAGLLGELGAVPPGSDEAVAATLERTWQRWVLAGTRGGAAA